MFLRVFCRGGLGRFLFKKHFCCLYVLLSIYCFFIIWLLEGYKFIIKDFNISKKYKPLVTVLIAARNEEKNLDKLLFSLNNQEYPKN